MDEYRNYGQLILPGQIEGTSESSALVDKIKRSQVYQATHKSEDKYTDYMYRSFISFTFGKRHIEDFNLIATFADMGLEDNGYADFEDITSENNIVGGQLYWRTHIKARTLTFTLATDSLTQRQLDDFLFWFAPGKTRELVLAEHPNREAYARVSSPPQLRLIPFEQPIEVSLGYNTYRSTSTTVYRGTIVLELVLDEPYWHSLANILGQIKIEDDEQVFYDIWTDANGTPVNIFNSRDALKIVAEDGIPISTMIKDTMVFGDNIIAEMGSTGAHVAPEGTDEHAGGTWNASTQMWEYDLTANPGDWDYWNYRIAVMDISGNFIIGAKINSPYITAADENDSSRVLLNNKQQYFYYAGTAKSYPTLKFTIVPELDNNGYISNIRNKFATAQRPFYNTITIESQTKSEFKFTTPGLFTAYNQAIYIFKNVDENDSKDVVRTRIRDQVKHHAVRAYANSVLDSVRTEDPLIASNLVTSMSNFFKDDNQQSEHEYYPAAFSFNSKTGEAIGTFTYNINDGTKTETEQVGDMIKSSYLIITDRNYPNDDGIISGWEQSYPQNSYKLTHDLDTPLYGIVLEYKNMYW